MIPDLIPRGGWSGSKLHRWGCAQLLPLTTCSSETVGQWLLGVHLVLDGLRIAAWPRLSPCAQVDEHRPAENLIHLLECGCATDRDNLTGISSTPPSRRRALPPLQEVVGSIPSPPREAAGRAATLLGAEQSLKVAAGGSRVLYKGRPARGQVRGGSSHARPAPPSRSVVVLHRRSDAVSGAVRVNECELPKPIGSVVGWDEPSDHVRGLPFGVQRVGIGNV